MQYEYDLIVIGGGSGGVRAARMAAQRGKKVALIEGDRLGGTCVNVGCIPKKLYSYAAHYAEGFKEAAGYGLEVGEVKFNWETLKANRAKEIERLNGLYQKGQESAGTEIIRGWASLKDGHTVKVDDKELTAHYILIAVGSEPFVPDVEGKEHILVSDDIFDLPTFPKKLLIVGGGYIASEFASIFNGLGCHVTQVVRQPLLLRGFDEEVREFVTQEVVKSGVNLLPETQVTRVEKKGEVFVCHLDNGETVETDYVVYATGRKPKTDGLNLEAVGVKTEKGAVLVDEHYNSSVDSIFALGDVIDRLQLTPVAINEAMVFVDHVFGDDKRKISYDFVPTAVFTHPNIGTVGYTETEARDKFANIDIYRSRFKPLIHTLSGHDVRVLIKMIVDRDTERVVGIHMVGPDAGEIIQGFAVAVKAGLTKAQFDATIAIHPTSAEELVTLKEPS